MGRRLEDRELEILLNVMLEKSGMGKNLNANQKNQLIQTTIANIRDADIHIDHINISSQAVQKGLFMALTATFIKEYTNDKRFKLTDFRTLFKEPEDLTPEERLEREPFEKIFELVLERQIIENFEELIEEVAEELELEEQEEDELSQQQEEDNTPALMDDAGNILEKLANTAESRDPSQSKSQTVSGATASGDADEIEHIKSATNLLDALEQAIVDCGMDSMQFRPHPK